MFYYLYLYLFISLKMAKKNESGVPNTFKRCIENIKLERLRKHRLRNVELDITLIHFISNGLETIQYQIIQGDCEDIAKLTPKRKYALVIAKIPHGFNFPNIEYDTEAYTYQAFNKWLRAFKKSQHHHFGDL